MTLDTFFKKFDQFADAPDAVAKMRELVLELAVQGKLVEPPSKPETDPAWLTFKKEISERIYGYDPGSTPPFDIPEHWEWSVLGEVAKPCGQKTPDENFTYIDVGSIDNARGELKPDLNTIEPAHAPSRARKLAKLGSVIYATVRPYLKNIAVIEKEFCPPAIISTAFAILHPLPFVEPRFLFYWLRSSAFEREVSAYAKGVAYPAISDGDLKGCVIPVPPLAEQKRIVAKVDELMALCDRLETQQQERDEQASALARASLARFAEAPTPANLNLLFHKSYSISPADLRKSILTLAVQGKLVKQDPKEGKTTVVTMEELVGRKNLKNGLSLSPTADPTDFVCLPLSAVNGSNLDCSYGKPIAISAERAAPYLIEPGDIFIMRGNGSKERVGIAAMARTAPPNVLFPDLLIRVPLPPARIDGEYFLIAWNNPLTRKTVEALAATTAGIWKINQGHISECSIPIPPLAEQRRIVARVDQLMALVDQLETQLATTRSTAKDLLEALVAELTTR